MPELPDLEVLTHRLQILIGDSIESVDIRFPLTFRMMVEGTPQEILPGKKIEMISRRGKFLMFHMTGMDMVMNLMLTGRLTIGKSPAKSPRNTVVTILFSSGDILHFADYKKMGKVYVTNSLENIPQFRDLGIEPFSEAFTPQYLAGVCTDERPIKLVLTDQKLIAGIGNGYSDEILFDAKINPRKSATSLTENEIARVYDSVIHVLHNAVDEIQKRAGIEEDAKEIRQFFRVHGKKGQPCPLCGSTIREISISGRSTHACPRCQNATFP
jgi:formamidopyrimidine-DNA glycosylase